jgi:dihydrofolate reductase
MTYQNEPQEKGTQTRKIVAGLFMSLDGVVEAPSKWGFQFMTAGMSKDISAGIAQADAVLMGRRTYEEFARIWPGQGSEVPMADFLNHTQKYVVSATLKELVWQPATLIKGNLAEELKKLKQQPGGNIQIPGSPTLVRYLLSIGLLDMFSLSICPVVVGAGLHLFDDINKQVALKVVHSTILENGVIGVTYRPAGDGGGVMEPPVSFPEAAVMKRPKP